MSTIRQKLDDANRNASEFESIWFANKDKVDHKSRKAARDAAEKLEFWSNKLAMLDVMSKSEQFKGR